MGIYEQLRNRIFKREADGSFPLWKAVAGEFKGTISLRLWCSSHDVPALHKPFLLVPVPLSLPYLICFHSWNVLGCPCTTSCQPNRSRQGKFAKNILCGDLCSSFCLHCMGCEPGLHIRSSRLILQ